MRMHHYCNCELSCPECVRRFWKWAENYSRRAERAPRAKKDPGAVNNPELPPSTPQV